MARYAVPVILEVTGVMIVEAASKKAALKKAKEQDYIDVEVNVPIDINDVVDDDVVDNDDIERLPDGEDN